MTEILTKLNFTLPITFTTHLNFNSYQLKPSHPHTYPNTIYFRTKRSIISSMHNSTLGSIYTRHEAFNCIQSFVSQLEPFLCYTTLEGARLLSGSDRDPCFPQQQNASPIANWDDYSYSEYGHPWGRALNAIMGAAFDCCHFG